MLRYFIEIMYDGGSYHGWQLQPGQQSVQQALELSLLYKAGLQSHVTGCGRTDAGVSARQFFAHFDLPQALDEKTDRLVAELNRFLPPDITVRRIFAVPDHAHARFDATRRTYKYYICFRKNPFVRHHAWTYTAPLNVDAMNQAAAKLLQYSDFTSFAKLHTDTKTNICHLQEASWETHDDLLVFTITADRFLRNMVRAIVGTLVDTGRGKISPDAIHRIIRSQNRSQAGMSVPAQGLFLEKVIYNHPWMPA
ncbi:MAG: tRNA pseudouridine(38-40) synthase TruA [Bacteroidales bacterium]|nr:tRNA pseudouridine(38-40) synthase TruA [Bacteroidales bacterium]